MLRRHTHAVIAMGILLVAALPQPGCPNGEVVIFRDAGLEGAVRQALGKPLGFLTKGDLLGLRRLDARSLDVRRLDGLEFATNLTFLDLDSNQISDVTVLANLVNLQTLNLDSNEVFDITPLAGLLNLNVVSLFDNQVADVSALVTNARNGGLGFGDTVILDDRTIGQQARDVDIPTLRAFQVNVQLVVPAG